MHLRAGREFIAAGMFVIPTGTFTIALHNAGCWRFHLDETFNYVKPTSMMLPVGKKTWELSFNSANRRDLRPARAEMDRRKRKKIRLPLHGRPGRGLPPHPAQRRPVHVSRHRQPPRSEEKPPPGKIAADVRGRGRVLHVPRSRRRRRRRERNADPRHRPRRNPTSGRRFMSDRSLWWTRSPRSSKRKNNSKDSPFGIEVSGRAGAIARRRAGI